MQSDPTFQSWSTPSEFLRRVEALGKRLGERAMFGEGQTFRDGFVAGRFANYRVADKVRLLAPRSEVSTPDFALLFGEEEQRFEITEADRPGRKRGEEYRNGPLVSGVRALRDDEWTDAASYAEVVQRLVTNKAAKQYDRCDGLIVWSNAFGIADEEKLTSSWWTSACRSGVDAFKQIWVHHRGAFEQIARR